MELTATACWMTEPVQFHRSSAYRQMRAAETPVRRDHCRVRSEYDQRDEYEHPRLHNLPDEP